ncbi:MAG: membrane dipeptidase [Candidatus Cyclobacteriaceae bacterium M3_2C_046]
MSYADLHTHSTLKTFLTAERAAFKSSPYKTLIHPVEVLRSKASLEQAIKGKVRLLVNICSPMERPMGAGLLLSVCTPLLSQVNYRFMNRIFQRKIEYFELLQAEISHLLKAEKKYPDLINILEPGSSLQSNKLNIIMAIEGSHSFENSHNLLDNFIKMKLSGYRFLYLTLVHLARSAVCNHAYAIKQIKSPEFKPAGKGISALGYQMIKEAYDDQHGPPILIDIKHMSLYARLQFYRFRKENHYQTFPIIASHCGVTGISYHRIHEYIKDHRFENELDRVTYFKPTGIGSYFLNPASINIYDEEIIEIIESKGILGFSLDQRILGYGNFEVDYFYGEEFSEILKWNRIDREDLGNTHLKNQFKQLKNQLSLNKRSLHLRLLCNNILHFVKIGGEKAWRHVCLGSDYDGMINPVNNCKNLSQYPSLEQDLNDVLPKMIALHNAQFPQQQLAEEGLETKINQLMYQNLVDFVGRHYQ